MRTIGVFLPALLCGNVFAQSAPAVILPELAYAQTQRADYFVTDRRLKLDIKRVERFLVRAERLLGATVPRFRFVRVASAIEVDYGCFGYHDGHISAGMVCPGRVRAYSVHKKHDEHEVVHLVWGAAFPDYGPGPFWEEGFATLIGDRDVSQKRARRLVRKEGSLEAVRAVSGRADWYNASAAFQQWLVRRYGMWRLVAFFRRCATEITSTAASAPVPGISRQAATAYSEALFEQTFGITLKAAEAEWLGMKKARSR